MYLLFCFKQKTAYEMRISDWSSDVCSSDLPTSENADQPAAPIADDSDTAAIADETASSSMDDVDTGIDEAEIAAAQDPLQRMTLMDFTRDLQIGRESGRERVCQYV